MSEFTNINVSDRSVENSQLADVLNKAGIKIPAKPKREYFEHPGYPSIKTLALEEVANGRDPLDSEQVRKALARIQLDERFHQHNEVKALETRETFQNYAKHFDQISTELIDRFDTAIEALRDLIAEHPRLRIDDGAPGPDMLVAYAHAVEADYTATQAATGLGTLRRIINPTQAEPGVYWYLDPTYEQVKAHNIRPRDGLRLSMFDTLKAGISVEYAPDYKTAKSRANSIERERQDEQRRRVEQKEHEGFGL